MAMPLPIKLMIVLLSYLAPNLLVKADIPDVVEYWPEVKNDLTLVTWSHGTNSRQELEAALTDGNIMMIEADVIMGRLYGESPFAPARPVMAHPPNVRSDIPLDTFLKRVLEELNTNPNTKKGIKLDFKSIGAAFGGMQGVSELQNEIVFPLWVNADIADGPWWDLSHPVDPDAFLQACNDLVPQATLSIGWKTSPMGDKYSWEMVQDMYDILQRKNCLGTGKRITFPVNGKLAGDSLEQFVWLLNQTSAVQSVPVDKRTLVGNAITQSTVTIWGKDRLTDEELTKLRSFIEVIGRDRCFTDTTADVRQGDQRKIFY